MTSEKKPSPWLTNYYLRGAIALVVALGLHFAGVPGTAPFWIAVVVWFVLFLAARVVDGYAGTERKR